MNAIQDRRRYKGHAEDTAFPPGARKARDGRHTFRIRNELANICWQLTGQCTERPGFPENPTGNTKGRSSFCS
jgi:hypothetical protein